MTIRFANSNDCPSILKIYSQYIHTPITFEYTLPAQQEFTERIAAISSTYPYLVCEENNTITGYAYAARHRDRAAYQWSAELSIYLDQSSTAKGLGRQLYTTLINILKLQGIRTVYGGVTVPNEKSEAFHKALGFRILGSFHNVGYKDGKWRDVTWFEKEIGDYSTSPQPLISIGDIPAKQLQEIMPPFE